MPSKYEKKVTLQKPYEASDAYIANMESTVAVIVTHPWGPLGGNMYNNVVNAIVLYFQRIQVTTIRFNFIGNQLASTGMYQVEQIQAVARQLLSGDLFDPIDMDYQSRNDENSTSHDSQEQQHHQQHQQQSSSEEEGTGAVGNTTTSSSRHPRSRIIMVLPKYILLVGYSYGSLLAGSASVGIPQCIGTVYISPPFGVMHWLYMFHGSYHLRQASIRSESYFRRLFIIGTADNFTTIYKFTATIEEYFKSTTASSTTTGSTTTTTAVTATTNENEKGKDNNNQQCISSTGTDSNEPRTSSSSPSSPPSSPLSLLSSATDDGSGTITKTAAAIIKDSDHFFARREKDVLDVIGQWLQSTAYPKQCNNDLNKFKSIEIDL